MTAATVFGPAQASAPRVPKVRDTAAIADAAIRCLLLELETWPKPGLVSHIDNGSHHDMNADTFRRSVEAIGPYFRLLANAGGQGCGMGRLRIIGLEAEGAMFAATSGVNTHRGAIFGLGLLCAAAGVRSAGMVDPALSLGNIVARRWGQSIASGPVLLHSHGSAAYRQFRAGGARVEAAEGFPSIYQVGLPALTRVVRSAPGDAEAARVEACFALISSIEDTNLLHRGGLDALDFARRTTRSFLDRGGVRSPDWLARAKSVHEAFVARRISPGGAADLLAMTLFVNSHDRLKP